MKILPFIFVVFLLGGCALVPYYEAAKTAFPVAADKAADKAYDFLCNLRHNTEQRFLARRQVNEISFKMVCKRRVP